MADGNEVKRQPLPGESRVEIGWLLSGGWSAPHREATVAAAEDVRRGLAALLPEFEWHLNVVERHEASEGPRVEPVLLLDDAEVERDRHGWDFVFVLTEAELVSYARHFAMAAPSRVFSTAVISAARLAGHDQQADLLRARLAPLAMHLFGRLNGLDVRPGGGYMRPIDGPRDLDGSEGFAADEVERMRRHLASVADLRVEEMRGRHPGAVRFYAQSLWENRRALPHAILRMRPWAFPARLSRLTTAAGSALAVLMMTAESWEVAANLSTGTLVLISLAALAGTSAYLLRAQRLLARPGDRALREQRAITNVSTVLAVAVGMAVTYFAIYGFAWVAGQTLFPDALLGAWVGTESLAAQPVRARLAGLAAALSIIIGALGASFEPHGYFRHVTQIDDEI